MIKHFIHLFVAIAAIFGSLNLNAQQKHNAITPSDPATQPVAENLKGTIIKGVFNNSKIYPNTTRNFQVFIPKQYDGQTPACLLVGLDGNLFNAITVVNNLINSGEMPVTIGVFVEPGVSYHADSTLARYNRSNEFDRTNEEFATFLETEFLPYIESLTTPDGKPIRLSHNPNDRAITGASSSGIAAFTVAWERPDLFSRVYSSVGTFVAMRGGNEYPAIVRKTEPKALRIFLQDGVNDTWNYIFGDWWEQNQLMSSALNYAGYEFDFKWDRGTHSIYYGTRAYPDAMRWLWRGWPTPVKVGESMNGMLESLLVKGCGWKELESVEDLLTEKGLTSNVAGNSINDAETDCTGYTAVKLFAAENGCVSLAVGNEIYVIDTLGNMINNLSGRKGERILDKNISADSKNVYKNGYRIAAIADAVRAKELSDGRVYITDKKGNIWLANGKGGRIAAIKLAAVENGGCQLGIYPNNRLLFTTEKNSNWLISYIIEEDGTISAGQRFYWLHNTENHTQDAYGNMFFDTLGNLYIATPIGVQVCDQNGRVRAILTVPSKKIDSVVFSGNYLYIISGGKLYVRRVQLNGHNSWAEAIDVKSQGQG